MINKRLFGAPIKGKVKEKLQVRQSSLGTIEQNSLYNKTPFIRMWTSLKFLSADTFIDGAEQVPIDDSLPRQNSPSGKKIPMVQESRDITNEKIVVNKTNELTMDDILNALPKALDTTNDPDVPESLGRTRGSIGVDALNEDESLHGVASDEVKVTQGVDLGRPGESYDSTSDDDQSYLIANDIEKSGELIELENEIRKDLKQDSENKIVPEKIDNQFDKVYVKNPTKQLKQPTEKRNYDAARTYVLGDDNYQNYIKITDSNTNEPITDNPNTEINELTQAQQAFENIFPKESTRYGGRFLKPQAGITSLTSETDGTLGVVKRTTVEFTVHNFYDFDKIYNKFFLKPGATLFVDFGWSSLKELYNPDDLINHQDGVENFLYNEPESDTEHEGFITKNYGDLETIFGLVTDYEAQVQKNGSVNCSVTITSTNSTLLDADNNKKFKDEIKQSLEEGLYYYCLKKLSKLTVNTEDEKQFDSRYLPNIDSPQEELEKVKKGLATEFSATFGSYNNINSLGMQFGVYAGNENIKDTYITWGMFEDYLINGHLGFGKNVDDINKGNNFQVRMDSSESYTTWGFIHQTVFSQRLKEGKAPDILIPEKWGKFNDNGKQYSSYSYRVKKYPGFKGGVNSEDSRGNTSTDHYLIDNNNNDRVSFGKIPLREVFIKVEMIQQEFDSNENHGIKDIIQSILEKINEESDNLFDWVMVIGDTEAQIKIVDQNYGLNKTITETGINWFTFDIMSNNSQVVDYNLAFKIPQGSIGDYYSIIGMGHENSIFTISDKVRKVAASLSLDLDNPSLYYQPDFEGFRGQIKLNDSIASDKSNIYNRIDDLLQTGELNTIDSDIIIPESEVVDNVTLYEKPKSPIGGDNSDEKGQNIITDYVKHNNDIMRNDGRYDVARSYTEYLKYMCGKEVNTKGVGLLPFTLELKINGISSIVPGDTFRVNYLPKMYSKKSYLQTMKVSHDVNSDGWYTTLQTQFRELFPSLKNNVFKSFVASSDSVRMSAHGFSVNPFNIAGTGIGPFLYDKKSKKYVPAKFDTIKKIITDAKYDINYSGYFDFVFDIRLTNVKDVIGKDFGLQLGHVPDGIRQGGLIYQDYDANYLAAGYLNYGTNEREYDKARREIDSLGLIVKGWNAANALRECNNEVETGGAETDILIALGVGQTVRTYPAKMFSKAGTIYYLNYSLGNTYLADGYRYKLVIKKGLYGLIGPYLNDNESLTDGMENIGKNLKTKQRVKKVIDFYDWVSDNDDGLIDSREFTIRIDSDGNKVLGGYSENN